MTRTVSAIGVVLLGLMTISPSRIGAQNAGDANAEFKRQSAELSEARVSGTPESESQLEKCLAFLDSMSLAVLNASPKPDVDAANQRLAGVASHTPPVGENYRLVKLGGSPATYALVANFGLGGPAAVRLYSAANAHYVLAAKIDHFSQKDFFDSDVELITVSDVEPVFVTVSGRTDDLSTGIFSVWRFDGHRIAALWNSDLLQQSNYEVDASGFHLAYCGHVDEDRPDHCLGMTRDMYRFQGGEWKRIETSNDPTQPLPTAK